jgi:hypothetical protein
MNVPPAYWMQGIAACVTERTRKDGGDKPWYSLPVTLKELSLETRRISENLTGRP